MIYIEVRFGTINGQSITIDEELDVNSTNPAQNKAIATAINLLQQQVNNVASQVTRDVISVATYQDLLEIDNPEENKVYTVRNTGDIYIWNDKDSEWVLCTNRVIGGTIYTDDTGTLISIELDAGKSYPVIVANDYTSEAYTLIVSADGTRVLINKEGWATVEDNTWLWRIYSYEGHHHETTDINGLKEMLTTVKIMYVQEVTSNPSSISTRPAFNVEPTLQTNDNTLFHYYDKVNSHDYGYWKWNGSAMEDTGKMLNPNTSYIWGTLNTNGQVLNIAFEPVSEDEAGKFNEYMFQFTVGATYIPTLIMPNVSWFVVPSLSKNITYQISVVNNVAAFLSNSGGLVA